MNENLKDQDILLVKHKNSKTLFAATDVQNGQINGIENPQNAENPNLIRIDKGGNMLENFFQNFMSQVKNPTQFEFFKVPAEKLMDVYSKLYNAFQNPDRKENKEFIDMHRIEPKDYLNQKQQSSSNAIDENRIDWGKFERIGVTREMLEKSGNLDKLLNWQKTDLMPVVAKQDDTVIRLDARLGLRETPDGSLSISVHSIKNEPELDKYYFGIKFTNEDKENLLKTGNLGRVALAEFKQGEKTPVLISIDSQTNELVSVRADRIRVADSIKGVQLNEQQKSDLTQGKAVYIEGMTSKKGTPFDAYVQYNAEKKGLEFRFDNTKQNHQHSQSQEQSLNAPKTFRKKELTGDQRDSLQEGKTVYVDGLTDKKGKQYSGYITLNKETGKTDFMFSKDYKDALAAGKVTPDDRHKTQVAVNSEGKTNEATKKVKEPLEKGQADRSEKQAEKQEVKKSKGTRIS